MKVHEAYGRAVAQIGDPAFRPIMWLAVGAAALVLAALVAAALWAAAGVPDESLGGWAQTLADFAGGAAALVAAWFLFPVIVTGVLGIFIDDIAAAVERRHYPADPPGRDVPFLTGMGFGLRFAGLALMINLLLLPAYAISLFLPPLALFLFYFVNGYLLGREYFGQVGLRHVPFHAVRELERRHRGRIFRAGIVGAIVLTVPVLNLVAPLVATAAMVHLWKDLAGRGEPARG